jgi:hypothetical protein
MMGAAFVLQVVSGVGLRVNGALYCLACRMCSTAHLWHGQRHLALYLFVFAANLTASWTRVFASQDLLINNLEEDATSAWAHRSSFPGCLDLPLCLSTPSLAARLLALPVGHLMAAVKHGYYNVEAAADRKAAVEAHVQAYLECGAIGANAMNFVKHVLLAHWVLADEALHQCLGVSTAGNVMLDEAELSALGQGLGGRCCGAAMDILQVRVGIRVARVWGGQVRGGGIDANH